jgi:O-antigen/teichoic acid export membrane protein
VVKVSVNAVGRGLLRGIRTDPLVRNSFYLVLTTLTIAIAGFGFWVINARIFTESQVGAATALITAVTLLSYLSQAGMNVTLVRHLGSATDPGEVVSAAVGTVVTAATLLGLGYVLLLPVIAPQLTTTLHWPWTAVAFVVMAVGSAVNLLTDSIFVASRAAGWNFALDGLLMGAIKIGLSFVVVGLGAFGIFTASAAAATLAALASLAACRYRLGMRLRPRPGAPVLRETWSYSAANYLANSLNLVPIMVMPLALLNGSGTVATAGFFIAFQIALILNSVSFAVCEAMFAEGSRPGDHLRRTALRAAVLIASLLSPAVLVVLLAGERVLAIFGPAYVISAGPSLVVLTVGTFAVAGYNWGCAILKIAGHLVGVVLVNLVYAGVIVGLVIMWSDRGPIWASSAWVIGNLVSGLLAVLVGARSLTTPR